MTILLDADLPADPFPATPAVAGPAVVSSTVVGARRLRQQVALSEFGLHALRTTVLDDLLRSATEHCARGLSVTLCKILRLDPDTNTLHLHAGTGWMAGAVGHATVDNDLGSPAGYALRSGEPVISNQLDRDQRFRTPTLMSDHGIRRAVNVLITAHRRPWGVLEADSAEPGDFDPDDVGFLQNFANLLGVAIERHDAEHRLAEAAEHQRLLAAEAGHRIKNSLAMVASLLRLQARSGVSPDTAAALHEAESRISTIATAHDQLWRSDTVGEIALHDFLHDLCARLRHQAAEARIHCEAAPLAVPAERAIALGLLVTELLTDAMRHALPGQPAELSLSLVETDDGFVLEFVDHALRPDAPPTGAGLGRRMIDTLCRQLRATVETTTDPHRRVRLTAPR